MSETAEKIANNDDSYKSLVGWVGTGKMGAPMVRNLLSAGWKVSIAEPDKEKRLGLVNLGATAVTTFAGLGNCSIVFSTLPSDEALLDVIIGSDDGTEPGLSEALCAGTVFVEMSTVSPECSRKVSSILKNKGIFYLRAPISGSTSMAESASLTVLASGDSEAWEAAQRIFDLLSTRQFYLGTDEEARFMKLVLNTLVGATSAIISEALTLGSNGGLTRKAMMEVICESAVGSPLLNYKAKAIIEDDFTPAFTVKQMMKDFTLISDAARQNNTPLLVSGLILEIYRSAANSGLVDDDFFSLIKWHRSLSEG